MSAIARIPVTKLIIRMTSSGLSKFETTPRGGAEPTVADILARWLNKKLTLHYKDKCHLVKDGKVRLYIKTSDANAERKY